MATSTIKQSATYVEKYTPANSSLVFDGYYKRLASFTFTATPSADYLSWISYDISGLGLSEKPRLVLPISCFPDAICYYDYDASSAQTIKIGVRNYSGGAYTSILRITCLIGIE